MSENLKIWNALSKTDPKHTKSFSRAGGFKGTAIKPIWIVKKLTEQFGPCGTGWGIGEPSFQVVPCGDEVLVFCTVSAWHTEPGNVLYGVGGDKVMVKRSNGPFYDDEAFKKAFTDAVGNAFKFVGVGADVHMGQFEDNKYVREVTAEFANDTNGSSLKQQLQESVRQETKRDLPFPQGPAKNRTELKTLGRAFWRDVEACGDPDQLDIVLDTNRELKAQIAADLPSWLSGWEKDGQNFEGLDAVIERKRTEFANEAWKNNPIAAG